MNRRTAMAALAGGFTRLRATGSFRVPVLVELFTSEGCSSCPPADQLLGRLYRQPPPGVEVIPLSEHVDYWNHLGWTDPFSSSVFSARQHAYSQRFKKESVYTPQVVIDGRFEGLGSDPRIEQAIVEASKRPRASVEVRTLRAQPDDPADRVRVRIEVASVPGSKDRRWDVVLVLTENAVASSVSRGENAGRRLTHTGVVRQLMRIAELEKPTSQVYSADLILSLDKAWDREQIRVVAFVQSPDTCAIAGARSCAV